MGGSSPPPPPPPPPVDELTVMTHWGHITAVVEVAGGCQVIVRVA